MLLFTPEPHGISLLASMFLIMKLVNTGPVEYRCDLLLTYVLPCLARLLKEPACCRAQKVKNIQIVNVSQTAPAYNVHRLTGRNEKAAVRKTFLTLEGLEEQKTKN